MGIRPASVEDLPAVAELYHRVARPGRSADLTGLVDYFRATLFEHPWTDPELPSLVYESGSGDIVGFIGSHVRRGRFGDQPVRIRCSGQLVSAPDAGAAVGPLLMRTVLAGPQDLAITDGATLLVSAMWSKLGGHMLHPASLVWTRPLRPFHEAGRRLGERTGDNGVSADAAGSVLGRVAASATGMVGAGMDRLGRRWLGVPRPADDVTSRDLGVDGLVEATGRTGVDRQTSIRLELDVAFARWLTGQLHSVTSRGTFTARDVLREGRSIGWYAAYFRPGGPAQVLAVRAANEKDLNPVVDRLLFDAGESRCTLLEGRIDAWLYEMVAARRFFIRPGERVLYHSNDDDMVREMAVGSSGLTRLAGEWWMGHHLDSVPITTPDR